MQGLTLEMICANNGALKFHYGIELALQLTTAVESMHKIGLPVANISPNSIIINGNLLKIIDFGYYEIYSKILALEKTPRYPIAPEFLSGQTHATLNTDIWYCGLVIYLMFCGGYPWPVIHFGKQMKNILEGNITFPGYVRTEIQDLLKSMMHPICEERPTISDVVIDLKRIKLQYDEGNHVIPLPKQSSDTTRKTTLSPNIKIPISTIGSSRSLSSGHSLLTKPNVSSLNMLPVRRRTPNNVVMVKPSPDRRSSVPLSSPPVFDLNLPGSE